MIAALTLFYASAVGAALWLSWPDEDLRFVGLALLFSFIISNLLWWLAPAASRPGVYSMLELLIVLSAALAYGQRREWGLAGVVVAAIGSIAANIGFASLSKPSIEHIRTYETVTNVAFLIECSLCAWVGGLNSVRIGRFSRLFDRGRRDIKPHARSKDQ